MQPITRIEYNGRQTVTIDGPAKMKSHMTVMPELARLLWLGLHALSQGNPTAHKIEFTSATIRANRSWIYTRYTDA